MRLTTEPSKATIADAVADDDDDVFETAISAAIDDAQRELAADADARWIVDESGERLTLAEFKESLQKRMYQRVDASVIEASIRDAENRSGRRIGPVTLENHAGRFVAFATTDEKVTVPFADLAADRTPPREHGSGNDRTADVFAAWTGMVSDLVTIIGRLHKAVDRFMANSSRPSLDGDTEERLKVLSMLRSMIGSNTPDVIADGLAKQLRSDAALIESRFGQFVYWIDKEIADAVNRGANFADDPLIRASDFVRRNSIERYVLTSLGVRVFDSLGERHPPEDIEDLVRRLLAAKDRVEFNARGTMRCIRIEMDARKRGATFGWLQSNVGIHRDLIVESLGWLTSEGLVEIANETETIPATEIVGGKIVGLVDSLPEDHPARSIPIGELLDRSTWEGTLTTGRYGLVVGPADGPGYRRLSECWRETAAMEQRRRDGLRKAREEIERRSQRNEPIVPAKTVEQRLADAEAEIARLKTQATGVAS